MGEGLSRSWGVVVHHLRVESITMGIRNRLHYFFRVAKPLFELVQGRSYYFEEEARKLRFERAYPLQEDEWGLICPHSIGDTYIVCSFAEAILKKHGGKRVTAFVKPQYQSVPSLFPGVSRFAVVDDYDLMCLSFNEFRVGRYFLGFPSSNAIAMIGFKGVNVIDCYRALFRIPWDYPISVPRPVTEEELDIARESLSQNGFPEGATVILVPDANTSPKLSPAFWELLATQLKRRGYFPVTNVRPGTKPIPGTFPGEFPLHQIRSTAEVAGWVISLRNGLCELLATCRSRISVLYPSISLFGGPLFSGYSLKAIIPSTKAEEYEVGRDDEEKVIHQIIESALTCL